MRDAIQICDPDDGRIAAYRDIRERDLVGRRGRFVAEGKVVLRALLRSNRFQTESIFVLENRVESLDDVLGAKPSSVPLYITSRDVMDKIAGFPLHRGILAMGRRPENEMPAALLPTADQDCLIVVCCGISNHDNVGSIFRNAAAFGADIVLLDQTSCDPLYRKALRVSVGAALEVPFARYGTISQIIELLEDNNIRTFALSPAGTTRIEEVGSVKRAAILFGSEGEGLPAGTLETTTSLRIAMQPRFDSLNVAAAAAIALHQLSKDRI